MLGAVTRKELLNHLAGFRFWVGALLTVVLAASSTLVTARDYSLRLSSYRERAASQEERLRAVSVYSFLQPLVVRPPEALSVLDQGFDSRLGTDVEINLLSIPFQATGGHRGNELLVSVPAVDLTTIVSVVLGLLALLLTCDSVISEREGGMLRAVFAQGVSRWTVLAGKLAGGLLALTLPLGAGLLVSLVLFHLEVEAGLTPEQWLRVLGLVGSYLLYLSLMLLLGLLISLHVRSSPRALGISVLAWFVLVMILPGAARAIAGDLAAPQVFKRSTERTIAELQAEHDRRLAEELRRDPLRTAFSGHTAVSFASGEHGAVRYRQGSGAYYDSLARYYRLALESGFRQAARAFAVRQRYEERLRFGERLGAGLAALSPAFLLNRLSESFSGTSMAEHDHFLEACRQYRLELLGWLEGEGAFRSWRWFTDDSPERLQPWPQYLGLTPKEVPADRVHLLFSRLSEPAIGARVRQDRETAEKDPSRRLSLDGMPRFSYRGPGALASLRRAAPEAGALLLLNAVAALAAWARFRRYDLG